MREREIERRGRDGEEGEAGRERRWGEGESWWDRGGIDARG